MLVWALLAAVTVSAVANTVAEDPPYQFKNHGITVVIHNGTRGKELAGGATIRLGKPALVTCSHPHSCMLTVQAKAGLVDLTEGELCVEIDGVPDPRFCEGAQGSVSLFETERLYNGQHAIQLTATNQNGGYDGHISYWEVLYTLYDQGP